MMGENSFSGTVSTNANGQRPVEQTPVDQGNITPTKKFPLKSVIIFVVAALVGAGIAALVFLVFINRQPQGNGATVPIEYASENANDDSTIKEETTKSLDEKITTSTDESEKLSLKLNKVDYYQISDEYDKAIEVLDTIDTSSLDADDKYRVYTYYASTYEGKSDATQAKYYQDLADEILNEAYPD